MPTTADAVSLLRLDLARHEAASAREAACVATVLAHLDALTDPFDQQRTLVHVTASAIVGGSRGVVLHRHKRLGIWLQPGGHVDPGESVADAARREAVEEIGLPVAWPAHGPLLVNVDVHAGPRGHVHLDCRYLLLAPPDDPLPPSGESPDARWFAWDDAERTVDGDPQLLAAFRRSRLLLS